MELEFHENTLNCMKKAVWGVKNEEQTLEIKLPDAMPDIGAVLGARGQVLLRSKEWRGSSISVNGGVLVWVLYAPEEGGAPKTVEGWMPFGLRWELPESCREGSILSDLRLESIDSRSVSARKLLVRATVSAGVEALSPEKMQLFAPEQLPEDVQILRKRYPMELTSEAGERLVEMEEALPLPEHCAQVEKILYSTLRPSISECKLLGDKLVFRGVAQLHLLLRKEDGEICSCDYPLPFSQYAQLEEAYDECASMQVIPAVTSLEVECKEGLQIKAGILGQYTVHKMVEAELVADAYSNRRALEMQTRELAFPTVLDRRKYPLAATCSLTISGMAEDIFVTAGHPRQSRAGEEVELALTGTVQYLCAQPEGGYRGWQERWEGQNSIPAHRNAELFCSGLELTTHPRDTALEVEAQAEMVAFNGRAVTAVSGVTLGDPKPETQRPSLILRRREEASLWETAKACNSTVEAILSANDLSGEPEADMLLLIPVM